MSVDLTQILVAVITGLFTIFGTIATVLIQRYVKDQQMATLLENTLQNSLGKLQQASVAEMRAAAVQLPGVPPAVAPAVQYVLDHADEARKFYGLSDQALADKVVARIGVKNIQTNLAVAGSSAQTIPEPMAPVPATVNGGPETKAAVAQEHQVNMNFGRSDRP